MILDSNVDGYEYESADEDEDEDDDGYGYDGVFSSYDFCVYVYYRHPFL